MKVRIGVDVGGTFTDAVIIDDETYELIGHLKVPTTHDAPQGVAAGIVEALQKVMEQYGVAPEDVTFIAHGTTQATNALLEGDVAHVGVLGTGTGFEGRKARTDTKIERIELAPGRFLETSHRFVENSDHFSSALVELMDEGAKVVVAAAPFSVDDAKDEIAIIEEANANELPAVGSHEISKLYGLRVRTRTAVVNASILPKMIDSASMTEQSVAQSGIKAPLMIMRCDGGVMGVGEVMKRPILTMLSGPAAGVAGALMYEKISHGLFLEVGGTSTDISAVVNGRVMVDYAEVGGHKTYVTSLDVRTVGIGGGSMIRMRNGRIVEAGPRSAHIAGLPYAVFSDPAELTDLRVVTVRPREQDPDDYVTVENRDGKRFALTLTCAANVLALVPEQDYAKGNREAARLALTPVAEMIGCSVEEVAEEMLRLASAKNAAVVEALLEHYEMIPEHTILVGGGGGAASVVPHLAKSLGMKHRIAKNAHVISPIGVALAFVRDVVERTVANPTKEDIMTIRQEAEAAIVSSGADPATVEVQVEIDAQRNVLRAIATGATSMRTRHRGKVYSDEELLQLAAESMNLETDAVLKVADTGTLAVFSGTQEQRSFFGLLRRKQTWLRIIDREGVIRLQLPGGFVRTTRIATLAADMKAWIEQQSSYGDAGIEMPRPYVIAGGRIVDLSGLLSAEQVASVAQVELGAFPEEQEVVVVLAARKG